MSVNLNKFFVIKVFIIAVVGVVLTLAACKKNKESYYYVQFAATSESVSEGTKGNVLVQVLLATPRMAEPITISYTIGGTAVAGTHYTIENPGTVTIPADSSFGYISLQMIENLVQQGNKTIVFTITGAQAGGKELPLGTLNLSNTFTILDDKCSPYIKGTWNYNARYWSYLGTTQIPANQAGQGLADGANPYYQGTVVISDPDSNRSYSISDVMVGQFTGYGIATQGALLDSCGNLSYSTVSPPLFFGVYPVKLTMGNIVSADSITLSWTVYTGTDYSTPVFRGEAGLKQ